MLFQILKQLTTVAEVLSEGHGDITSLFFPLYLFCCVTTSKMSVGSNEHDKNVVSIKSTKCQWF